MTTGQIAIGGGVVIILLFGIYWIIDSNNQAVMMSTQNQNVNQQVANVPIWQQLFSGLTSGAIIGLRTSTNSNSNSNTQNPGAKANGGSVTRTYSNTTLSTRDSGPASVGPGTVPTSPGDYWSYITTGRV